MVYTYTGVVIYIYIYILCKYVFYAFIIKMKVFNTFQRRFEPRTAS